MINFTLYFKRKKLLKALCKAFPEHLREDLEMVVNSLSWKVVAGENPFSSLYESQKNIWRLPGGETVEIPYRIFWVGKPLVYAKRLTPVQQMIYHCIFSRSYDGYVRESNINALLKYELPDWAKPYIIKVCGEYVSQILDGVYSVLSQKDCRDYKKLCALNTETVRLEHARMISYWAEFYRYDCYRFKDYIGKKLFAECFGFRKTGQKNIIIE